LTINKRMSYRGDANEEYSNTYMLSGGTPADSNAWRVLFDALVLEEKKLYRSVVSVVGGYGYNKVPGPGDSAVWSVDLTVSPNAPVPGTYAGASADTLSGDTACWVRWGLDRFNTKGKRVYLRKYFHPAYREMGQYDQTAVSYVTALNAFGVKMRDGSFAGSRIITDRLGTAVVGSASSAYVTTRTLKRRGKRPGS
jgi:hypothetical protein